MNVAFQSFIASSRSVANDRGIEWDIPFDADGTVPNNLAWNLTKLANAVENNYRLNDLGGDNKTIPILNKRLAEIGRNEIEKTAFSKDWQDLIKAVTVEQLLLRRNTPLHVWLQTVRPLKVIATCVQAYSGAEPWEMSADDITFACDVAAKVQASGKLGELVASLVKTIFDAKHLCTHGPFFQLLSGEKKALIQKRGPQMLGSLSDRKRAELLPDAKALWELIRIVFTEKPRNFLDAIRFAQIRVMVICGFRVGEVCNIPVDWKRVKEYVSIDGGLPEKHGGVSRSIMIRHFAEKQKGRNSNSIELIEAVQHVPIIFEDILAETLERIDTITALLRERLRLQFETRRFFPELPADSFIDQKEMYVRLTGNPAISHPIPKIYQAEYLNSFDPSVLKMIATDQTNCGRDNMRAYINFWSRAGEKGWDGGFREQVDKYEQYVRDFLPTKHSDTTPLPLRGGQSLPPYELLFLVPKRALSESRNDGICDITRYFSVGITSTEDIISHLSGHEKGIFARYGETEEDRKLSLNTHSLRHLQNTELFRQGIADTIITKRFNRRSVAQSYEYDHRSLAEQLSAMDLPPAAKRLPEKPRAVAALIKAGKAGGPIIDQFKRIQREEGDDEAFSFLAVEADGFHATPYGFCVNSFIIEPCPKHLQCFDGCKYLVACLLDRQRANLERLRDRFLKTIEEILSRPKGKGRDNQLQHAERMLTNIEKLLMASPGDLLFADGRDHSDRIGHNNGPSIDAVI